MEQDKFLEQVAADWATLRGIAESAMPQWTHEQWVALPEREWWNAAQAIEHLVLSAAGYIDALGKVAAPRSGRPWKSTFVGRMLYKYAGPNPGIMVPAPKSLRPTKDADENVLPAFLRQFAEFAELIEFAKGQDLNYRFSSPVAPMAKLNVGDALRLTVAHTERHMRQAFRCVGEAWPQ